MNNDTFLIENYDIELAQDICKTIEEENIRNRAVANVLGAKISEKYFTETEVDTNSGLHNIALVQERLEISDIYIKNNYVDVRVYFNDNELCVPKIHFDKETLPLAYMFIKLNDDLSGATVTGFIMPSAINTSVEYEGYYPVNEKDLISYYDIEAMISEGFTYDVDDDILVPIFEYINGTIEDDGHFYRTLIASKDARRRLNDTVCANYIYRYISQTCDHNVDTSVDDTEDKDLLYLDNTEEVDTLEAATDEHFDFEDSENIIDNIEEEPTELIEENVEVLELSTDTEEDFDLEAGSDELETIEVNDTELLETDVESINLDNNLANEEQQEELLEENIEEDIYINEEITTDLETNEELLIQDEINEENPESTNAIHTLEEMNEQVDLSEVSELLTEYDNVENDNIENIEKFEEILDEQPQETLINNFSENEEIETTEDKQEPFNFSTEISPSINSYEREINDNRVENNEAELLQLLEEDAQNTQNSNEKASIVNNNEQIDVLFNENTPEDENESFDYTNEQQVITISKKSSKLLPLIGVLAIVAAIGYCTYTKVINNNSENANIEHNNIITQNKIEQKNVKVKEEAMPIESIEKTQAPVSSEEGIAESIPVIEDNLDASILISNLRVSWEIPVTYASNNTAKRYFTKLGKIIQLNLKTEMLLLNKPPITNKIQVELEFNKSNQKFVVKGITVSSGEKVVDDLIQNTVKSSLDINLNMDLSSLGNIQGNPTLVINL